MCELTGHLVIQIGVGVLIGGLGLLIGAVAVMMIKEL